MHYHAIEDESGDLVDLVPFCSDACHRAWTGEAYDGWSGCHEREDFDTYCAALPSCAPCVVNRFTRADGIPCPCGGEDAWEQLPSSYLDTL